MKETIRIWGSGCPSVWGSWFSFDLLKSPASPESLLFVQSKIAKLLAVSFLVSWDFLVCHWPADRQEGDSDLLIRRGKYMKIHTRLTRTAYIQLGYQRNSILSAQPEPYLTYKRQQRAAAASQNTKWHLSHCLRPSTSGSWHIWTKGCDIWNQEIWIKSRFGPMQCLVQTSMIQALKHHISLTVPWVKWHLFTAHLMICKGSYPSQFIKRAAVTKKIPRKIPVNMERKSTLWKQFPQSFFVPKKSILGQRYPWH